MSGSIIFVPVATVALGMGLFAENTPGLDALGGGSGWIGAGLLGAVLAWLMFKHLPAKDQQLKDLVDVYVAERAHDRTEVTDLRGTFALEQKLQREAHARQMNEMQALLLQTIKEMRTAVHDVKDTANTAILKTAVADERDRQRKETS